MLEVQTVAGWHAARGGSLLLLTLTLRHTSGVPLKQSRKGLGAAWRLLQQSTEWRTLRAGLVGFVSSLEVTYSDDHGWHPHLHVALLVSSGADASAVAREVEGLDWRRHVVTALGARFRPSRAAGLDVRAVTAAEYVTKIAAEVTQSDLKGSRSIWQLVDEGRWELVEHYADAMKGAQAVRFSAGLRDLVGLAEDVPEADLAVEDVAGAAVLFVPSSMWNGWLRDGSAVKLLEAIEDGCWRVPAGCWVPGNLPPNLS